MAAMTNAMDQVVYSRRNFNYDPMIRHPLWITERHFVYHLCKDEQGILTCVKDDKGHTLKSPRRLREMAISKLVQNSCILEQTNGQIFPTNTYPIMLSEAIFQREVRAIEWIVSTWPMRVLHIMDVIPREDYLENDYLTTPIESNDNMCLVDCFIVGLLKLKPESTLKHIDFSGFERDGKLCKELCRLPILWMKPSNRTVDDIHSAMTDSIEVTKDKVQRFLNRISVVYSNIDGDFKHGNKISPMTINLDLKITIDDVPFGLSLQQPTPFTFSCRRLWMKHIPEVGLSPANLGCFLDTTKITHFEYEEPILSQDDIKYQSVLDALATLPNLIAFSLPNSIDAIANPNMASLMNQSLRKLRHLQRLNFSYCNLQGNLEVLLDGLTQRLSYINLHDCRLVDEDIFFLIHWRPIVKLQELNLSCNNLKDLDQAVMILLEKMSHITCMSLSFCQLSIHSQALIARQGKECSCMKVLCMQGYTPLPRDDILELLHICAQIPTMQKVVLFPEIYGFPGNNEEQRAASKYRMMRLSYRYLAMRNRRDIELE